jgi:hypothetical protein
MNTPAAIDVTWNWKRFALKWLAVGVGFGLIVIVALGSVIWYRSRPKPPKPWNTNALIVKSPPGFSVHDDGKKLEFSYAVENTTDNDYQVEANYQVKLLIKTSDGSFSRPLPDEVEHINLPIFVPAKQTGAIVLELTVSGIPPKRSSDTDDEYHERVRAFCEQHLKGVKGFSLFDETNRYRVDFPRWLPERPKNDQGP